MKKRSGRKFTVGNITISIPLIFVLLFVISCGPRQLKSTRILATMPVGQTAPSCYPTIDKVYKSDSEIFLVSSWGQIRKSEGHRIRWEICSPEGERIHVTRTRYVTIHPNSFRGERILLDQKIAEGLKSGIYRVEMHLDDNVVASHNVEYVDRSIINHNINGAVILPFRFSGNVDFPIKPYLDTVSNAIYGEVKRVVKDTVPPAVAEERIRDLGYSRTSTEKYPMRRIVENFPKDIFVTGSLLLSREAGGPMLLSVDVYHKKTGITKTFKHSTILREGYYSRILADLIQGVLCEVGFLDYLRSL